MKKLMLLSTGFLMAIFLSGQAPDYFNYQAVLRNPDGSRLSTQEVSMQVELLRGSVDGNTVYLENHIVQTNEYGMVNLKIGDGTFFNEVDWEQGPYFIRISVNGELMGTTQLLSVPYALYAKRAGSVLDGDSDPTNEFQTLSINDKTLEISNGNAVLLPDITTPWVLSNNNVDIYYPRNVGIGAEASSPEYPLDIIKETTGDMENVLFRLRNTDEGGRVATSMALEVYEDEVDKTFYRSEFMLTSANYDQIPEFAGMTAIVAGGNGVSLASRSAAGSLRFYTTTIQDTISERARIDPSGRVGIGTKLPKAKLHVHEGDILIEDINSGVIMQSANGKYWRMTVNNSGTLVISETSIE